MKLTDKKAKRIIMLWGSFVVGIVIISSLFIPVEQVAVIVTLIDTILKYLPWG